MDIEKISNMLEALAKKNFVSIDELDSVIPGLSAQIARIFQKDAEKDEVLIRDFLKENNNV
jgi:hypothetical protein